MKRRLLLVLSLLASVITFAQAEDGVSFNHKEWELACDNTLTCRAAGYSAEEGAGGSVLLTRAGGANTVTHGRVVLADTGDDDAKQADSLTLWINDHSLGALLKAENSEWMLTDTQTLALTDAIKKSDSVEFRGGSEPFDLSPEGAFAVLLKMDEAQGRLNTPGALIRKGSRAESSVPPAIAMPVIWQAKTVPEQPRTLTADELARIKPGLIASLTDDDSCDNLAPVDDQPEEGAEPPVVTQVDASHVLITALCWRGAYNEGYGYWLMDSALQQAPELITDSGSEYHAGVISEAQKGRGIGDCWSTAAWVWDGQHFVQSSEATTGMCRAIRAGGAWQLPVRVSEVKPAS